MLYPGGGTVQSWQSLSSIPGQGRHSNGSESHWFPSTKAWGGVGVGGGGKVVGVGGDQEWTDRGVTGKSTIPLQKRRGGISKEERELQKTSLPLISLLHLSRSFTRQNIVQKRWIADRVLLKKWDSGSGIHHNLISRRKRKSGRFTLTTFEKKKKCFELTGRINQKENN